MLAKDVNTGEHVTIDPAMVVVKELWLIDNYYTVFCYSCGHKCYGDIEEDMEYNYSMYLYGDGSFSRIHSGYVTVNWEQYEDISRFGKWINGHIPKDGEYANEIIIEEPCDGCQWAIAHKDDTVNHGLQAFRKGDSRDVEESMQRLDDILSHPEWEVCCTNDHIFCGPIGITGTGNVSAYYPVDIWSEIDEDGSRCVTERGMERLKEYRESGTLLSDHDEYFVRSFTPTALWVKRWFYDRLAPVDRLTIRKKAQALGIELVFVRQRHEEV